MSFGCNTLLVKILVWNQVYINSFPQCSGGDVGWYMCDKWNLHASIHTTLWKLGAVDIQIHCPPLYSFLWSCNWEVRCFWLIWVAHINCTVRMQCFPVVYLRGGLVILKQFFLRWISNIVYSGIGLLHTLGEIAWIRTFFSQYFSQLLHTQL